MQGVRQKKKQKKKEKKKEIYKKKIRGSRKGREGDQVPGSSSLTLLVLLAGSGLQSEAISTFAQGPSAPGPRTAAALPRGPESRAGAGAAPGAAPPPASSFMQKEQVPPAPDTRCDCCQKTHSPFPEDSLQPGSSEPRERLPACLSVRECVHACVGVCWPQDCGRQWAE